MHVDASLWHWLRVSVKKTLLQGADTHNEQTLPCYIPASWGHLLAGAVLQSLAQNGYLSEVISVSNQLDAVVAANATDGHNGGPKACSHADKLLTLRPEYLVLLTPLVIGLYPTDV